MVFVLIIAAVFLGIFFLGNRWNKPHSGDISINNNDLPTAGTEISITTWNIGFASLGAKADLIIDGGKSLRPLSKPVIEQAAHAIGNRINAINSNVVIVQETANESFMNRNVPVKSILEDKLDGFSNTYWSDFKTRFTPLPLKFDHGMETFSIYKASKCSTLNLSQDPLYYYGFLKKYYGGLVHEIPIEGQPNSWVIYNIHLSAFDQGGTIRWKQLDELFLQAKTQFEAGNYVIIGGDWNMRISASEFPYKTPKDLAQSAIDFPYDKLPKEWHFAVDDNVPTCRSIHKEYVKSDNYTSILDGFLVSPNVNIECVTGYDLDFEHTDHHPVTARFNVKIV